jgi:hypothetical protein
MPSTPWSRSESTAPAVPALSPSTELTTRHASPASRTARSTAMSSKAGPYEAMPSVTTPTDWCHGVSRSSAAESPSQSRT